MRKKNHTIRILAVLTTFATFMSCGNHSQVEQEIARIKQMGDTNPELAMLALDSIRPVANQSSEYNQKKFELLEIRIRDKAYIKATSDIAIKSLVDYFDRNGTILDRQEAHYYAGGAYRDLQDTPRALEHYFTVEDLCADTGICDSVMVRNTYSNLHWLYFNVQDYKNALEMARKEYSISKQLDDLRPTSVVHMASSLAHLDSITSANVYFSEALQLMLRKPEYRSNEIIALLLYNFSLNNNVELANQCKELLKYQDLTPKMCMALAEHGLLTGKRDSALLYFNLIIDNDCPLENQYDAAKRLFEIEKDVNIGKAVEYAERFVEVSDSLNLGRRQELAATVNNQHTYHRNVAEERRIKEEGEKNYRLVIILSFSFAIILLVVVLLYIYSKYRDSRIIISKSEELIKLKGDKKQIEEQILKTEQELAQTKEFYAAAQEELGSVIAQKELLESKLREKKDELADRIAQTSEVLKLLHRGKMTESAEDVVRTIKNAIKGRTDIESIDWQKLYQAVDTLHPTFAESLVRKLRNFNEQQKHVCYLLKIGLTNPEIEQATELSHATAWRWAKKYREILEEELKHPPV